MAQLPLPHPQDWPKLLGHLGETVHRGQYSPEGRSHLYPPELLNRTLAGLQSTHEGIKKMQALGWQSVYWPGIDAYITDYVMRCAIWTWHKASSPAQPMLLRDIPSGLWQKIAADYFHHGDKDYLQIGGLFSKYPFLFCMTSKTAKPLAQNSKKSCSSMPSSILYSINCPPFTAEEFEQFLQRQCINHITSSPHFQWCNWFIGWQVKILKTALNTAKDVRTSLEMLLLELQSPWHCPGR